MILRRVLISAISVLALLPAVAAAERTVVLVTNEHCPVTEMTRLEIRKAYLGVSVSIDGESIRPLRLTADERLDQVFFQAIVAMSEKSYERRALSLALRFGTPRPAEYRNLGQALTALRRSPCAVLYVWAEDVGQDEDIKTIRVLWRGT